MSNQPTFVAIGDIHGNIKKLEAAMASEAYQQASTRIFMGDLVNGKDADNYAVLKKAIESDAIWLRGNHDEAFALLLELIFEYAETQQDFVYDDFMDSLGITKRQFQAFNTFCQDLSTNLNDEELNAFCAAYGSWYKKCPYFIRIGHTYLSHGGWHHMMLNAEQDILSEQLAPHVRTSPLDEITAHKVVFGHGLAYRNRPPKAHFLPPKNRLLIVGHHYREEHAYYIADNVFCIDSGCGKKTENDLTMVVFNQQGEILQTLTF